LLQSTVPLSPLSIFSTRIFSLLNNPCIASFPTRLLTVLAFFTGFGGFAIVYLITAIVVPEQTTAQSKQ
jgi:hypothetical protein